VIDLTHVKAKISKSYEAQRQLAREHNIFLADDRIINRLPQALGRSFYKSSAKRPISVVLAPARVRMDGKRVKRPAKKKTEDSEETAEMKKYARPVEEIVTEIEKAISVRLQ
jgi:ribosome biogenesis protein UTP30